LKEYSGSASEIPGTKSAVSWYGNGMGAT
jgi:hypothetical protein